MTSQEKKRKQHGGGDPASEYLLTEPLHKHYLNTMPNQLHSTERGPAAARDYQTQKSHPEYDGGDYYEEVEEDPLDGGEALDEGYEYHDDDQYPPNEDEEEEEDQVIRIEKKDNQTLGKSKHQTGINQKDLFCGAPANQSQQLPPQPQNPPQNVDLNAYKGIYFGDDTKKFQDQSTGAHFDYYDLCRRLELALRQRVQWEESLKKLNTPPVQQVLKEQPSLSKLVEQPVLLPPPKTIDPKKAAEFAAATFKVKLDQAQKMIIPPSHMNAVISMSQNLSSRNQDKMAATSFTQPMLRDAYSSIQAAGSQELQRVKDRSKIGDSMSKTGGASKLTQSKTGANRVVSSTVYVESSTQKQKSNYDYYKQSSSQVKNYPFTSGSATKGGGQLVKTSAKKETSETDRSALTLSKSARDLKKRDLFHAAKGLSQGPALMDGSQGSPRAMVDSKTLNKDLQWKGVLAKQKDSIRASQLAKAIKKPQISIQIDEDAPNEINRTDGTQSRKQLMDSITCRGESLLRKSGIQQKRSPYPNQSSNRILIDESSANIPVTERILRKSNLIKDGNSPGNTASKPSLINNSNIIGSKSKQTQIQVGIQKRFGQIQVQQTDRSQSKKKLADKSSVLTKSFILGTLGSKGKTQNYRNPYSQTAKVAQTTTGGYRPSKISMTAVPTAKKVVSVQQPPMKQISEVVQRSLQFPQSSSHRELSTERRESTSTYRAKTGNAIGNVKDPLPTEYLDSVEETSRSIHLITDNSIIKNQSLNINSFRNEKIISGKAQNAGFKGLTGGVSRNLQRSQLGSIQQTGGGTRFGAVPQNTFNKTIQQPSRLTPSVQVTNQTPTSFSRNLRSSQLIKSSLGFAKTVTNAVTGKPVEKQKIKETRLTTYKFPTDSTADNRKTPIQKGQVAIMQAQASQVVLKKHQDLTKAIIAQGDADGIDFPLGSDTPSMN